MSANRIIWGVILIAVGFLFLLDQMEVFDFSIGEFISDFWPLFLIIAGLIIIIRSGKSKRRDFDIDINFDAQSISPDKKKYSKTFGDQSFNAKGMDIDGLSISSTFGDINLNLAEGRLKQGVNKVSLSGVFGDITVVVPGSMEVLAGASNTFGDLDILGQKIDGISNSLRKQTDGYDMASMKVHISSGTTFGDIKIYRA
jgi:predicted membrane protein